MRVRSHLFTLAGAIAALIMVLIAAGCGDSGGDKFVGTATPATQVQCDASAPSKIPAPSGRPIFVEFFRDT